MMDEQSSNNSPDNSIHHLNNSRDTSSTSKPNQISNTLLKQFSYNEIHNRRVALGITCVQCTPVQLEILRRAGAMPVSSRRCGMITRREAERLCKSFLGDNAPPRLPDDFAFSVHHECAWGCRGSFLPSRYNSSRAKCIKCTLCGLFFSPNKFIFHSHRMTPSDKYVQPDAANFNSWRRHMKLSGSPPEEIVYAWEDVKAMFNGGTRKRLLTNTIVPMRSSKQPKLSESNVVVAAVAAAAVANRPIVPAPRLPTVCQDHTIATLPHISRVAMDFIYNKPFSLSASYASFPWLKRNPLLFPSAHHHDHGNGGSTAAAAAAGFFGGGPLDQTHKTQHSGHSNDGPHSSYHHHQSAFKPVQSIGTMEVHDGIDIDGEADPDAGVISPAIVSTIADDISRSGVTPQKSEQSDEEDEDDVDIETTDEKLDTDIDGSAAAAARANAAGPSQWSTKQEAPALANVQTSEMDSESPVVRSLPVPEHAQSQSFLARTQAHGHAQMPVPATTPDVLPSLTHRIWNISKLSFEGTNRANFLYRQNLHRHLFLGGDSSLMSTSAAISEIGTKMTSSLDCSTCMTQQNTHFTENINKID